MYPPKRDNFCHPKVPRDNFRSRFGNIILLVKREPPTRNYPAVVGAQAGLERCCCARILMGRGGWPPTHDWKMTTPYQRLPKAKPSRKHSPGRWEPQNTHGLSRSVGLVHLQKPRGHARFSPANILGCGNPQKPMVGNFRLD